MPLPYLQSDPSNVFRHPENNNLFLGALFLEIGGSKNAIYTLKDKDHLFNGKVLPSLYLKYIEEEDLTEYNFAMKYLENFEHWQKLCECTWFKDYVKRWRTELELKIKSRALKQIQVEAASGSKLSFQAARWLAEKGWIDKTQEPSRRGRPSKAEIDRLAQEELLSNLKVEEDLKRLGIN